MFRNAESAATAELQAPVQLIACRTGGMREQRTASVP
jgi:hypothetical protein